MSERCREEPVQWSDARQDVAAWHRGPVDDGFSFVVATVGTSLGSSCFVRSCQTETVHRSFQLERTLTWISKSSSVFFVSGPSSSCKRAKSIVF